MPLAIVPPQEAFLPKAKARQRKTASTCRLGGWQRLLALLEVHAALPHLEIPRTQLAALLPQTVGIGQQQAVNRAPQETASLQHKATLVDHQRPAVSTAT